MGSEGEAVRLRKGGNGLRGGVWDDSKYRRLEREGTGGGAGNGAGKRRRGALR